MEFRRFIKEHILFSILCVILFFVYRQIIGVFATLLALGFLVLYGSAMAACHFAMAKLNQLQKYDKLTQKACLDCHFLSHPQSTCYGWSFR